MRGVVTTRITNPKVATLAPTWRRHCGLSVLFDNPGTRLAPGVMPLEDLSVDAPDRQRLYDELAGLVAQVDPQAMRARYGFCPLPRHSYHVTVCDGPNQRDVGDQGVDHPAEAALLDQLPGSLDRAPEVLGFLCRARVLDTAAANPVTFEVADVAVWGQVLAARLEPPSPSSRVALERVRRARAELVDDLWNRLGLRTQPWRPHISLGYFPNRQAAQAATATLRRWNRGLAAARRPAIAFASASVYGFTDMVSFLRLGT